MNDEHTLQFNNILEKLRHPEKRTWIILNPTSIGDTALVCGFADAFVKTHGYSITMVVPEDHIPITQMYPGRFEQVLSADRQTMQEILSNYVPPHQFALDMPFCGHPYDLGDGRIDQIMYLNKYPGRGGLSGNDIFRHILRLPWDARLERPQTPIEWDQEALLLADSVGMEIGKSVIFFPANSSAHPQFPDVFWEALAARLTDNGYKVFTNMKGGNVRPQTMPIVGTTPIDIPVHLAISLVNLAGRMFSGAHGMQFLLLMAGKFRQMTVAMPIHSSFGDFSMNDRVYSSTAYMAQYMYPELCLNQPFAEFSVPFDAPEDVLKRLAAAMADDAFDDPNCYKRMASGRLYLDENADWLGELIQPAGS